MSGWQTKQIGHFPEYEMVTVDAILNKKCKILRCEIDHLTSEDNFTLVVHFLVHLIDENKDYEVRTGAQGIVSTINSMSPSEIEKLINRGEETMFVKEKTVKGFTMFKMV